MNVVVVVLGVALALAPVSVLAQENKPVEKKEKSFVFDNELVEGKTDGFSFDQIPIPKGPDRESLIRIRTTFVPEIVRASLSI